MEWFATRRKADRAMAGGKALLFGWSSLRSGAGCQPQVRQEYREQPDRRHEGADLIDKADARPVGELAEDGGADSADPKGEAEKEAGDHADAAGQQLLRIDDDGREGGGDDEADDDAEHHRRGKADIRKRQREGESAEDRAPDHVLAAETVADRSADYHSDCAREEENEEINLRRGHRHAELLDQEEGVVAR